MDEIYGKKPNVTPKAIASSLKPTALPEETDEEGSDTTDMFLPPKRTKVERKEEKIERRYQERLELQKKAVESFETVMQKLIDKL